MNKNTQQDKDMPVFSILFIAILIYVMPWIVFGYAIKLLFSIL